MSPAHCHSRGLLRREHGVRHQKRRSCQQRSVGPVRRPYFAGPLLVRFVTSDAVNRDLGGSAKGEAAQDPRAAERTQASSNNDTSSSKKDSANARSNTNGWSPPGWRGSKLQSRSDANRRALLAVDLGQPTTSGRTKSKFISLTDSSDKEDHSENGQSQTDPEQGEIDVLCCAESFDRGRLEQELRSSWPRADLHIFPGVVHASEESSSSGDIFFFDYGVVVYWGTSHDWQHTIQRDLLLKIQQQPLASKEVELEYFQYNYSGMQKPNISNDVITMGKKLAKTYMGKLAISHALAQSTKLGVYEGRILEVVAQTRHLPATLARKGKVNLTRLEVAKLMGELYLQRSSVTLLSTLVDTPEFFWSAPDHLQVLYERATQYLELEGRVQVLSTRFQVLQGMFNMAMDLQNHEHASRLEWIIIWLIVVEIVLGGVDFLALGGYLGAPHL